MGRPARKTTEICGTCGAWAPHGSATCAACGGSLSRNRRPMPEDPRIYVAIRLTFDCRGCGLPSPLDELVPDGTVRCVRCQLEQRFEEKWWVRILEAAHAAGDLMGDSAEGRTQSVWSIAQVNPFRGVAVARMASSGPFQGWLPKNLTVQLAMGHPLSEEARAPLTVSIRGNEVHASAGAEQARYALQPSARQLYPALAGVIADEHFVGREAPELREQQGATAFSCTSCGAALPVDGRLRLVQCVFCGATTHIPAQVRHSLERDPQPDTWWLVFVGGSPRREALERSAEDVRPIEELPPLPSPLWRTGIDLSLAIVLPGLALLAAGVIWRIPILVAWIRYLLF